jgi:transcriptional regulator with XRE-family HTH domain
MTVAEQINRSDIARKTGLHLSAISRFLSGDRIPNFKQAKMVADAMGVSLDELYRILYSDS